MHGCMCYESQKYNKGMNDTRTINQTNLILTLRRKDRRCFQADGIRGRDSRTGFADGIPRDLNAMDVVPTWQEQT